MDRYGVITYSVTMEERASARKAGTEWRKGWEVYQSFLSALQSPPSASHWPKLRKKQLEKEPGK